MIREKSPRICHVLARLCREQQVVLPRGRDVGPRRRKLVRQLLAFGAEMVRAPIDDLTLNWMSTSFARLCLTPVNL